MLPLILFNLTLGKNDFFSVHGLSADSNKKQPKQYFEIHSYIILIALYKIKRCPKVPRVYVYCRISAPPIKPLVLLLEGWWQQETKQK